MQYETPSEHLPCTHVFEQHWLPVLQVLPEVSQLGVSAAHLPLLHFPPQHWLSAVHVTPSEMHAAAAHFLFWQLKLQQSVVEVQASFVAPHELNTAAQVCVVVS